MKLKKPLPLCPDRQETRYLAHCKNIARILRSANSHTQKLACIDTYIQTTDAKLVDDKSS